jgi:hypothetical protein
MGEPNLDSGAPRVAGLGMGHTSFDVQMRPPRGSVGALAALAAALCLGGGSAAALAGPGQLRAFQRPARASDALPSRYLPLFAGKYGPVAASRRIATSRGFHGRAALYLVRLERRRTCSVEVIRGGAGAGCDSSGEFLSVKRAVSAGEGGRFLYGVVANNVARVAFLEPLGRLHTVRLTRDRGFLFPCRHRNGCVGLVSAVNGYDRHGRLVFHETL